MVISVHLKLLTFAWLQCLQFDNSFASVSNCCVCSFICFYACPGTFIHRVAMLHPLLPASRTICGHSYLFLLLYDRSSNTFTSAPVSSVQQNTHAKPSPSGNFDVWRISKWVNVFHRMSIKACKLRF